MKLIVSISVVSTFAILVSSDDQTIIANTVGQKFIDYVESILQSDDAVKANEIYADDYELDLCGKTYNKTMVVDTLLQPADDVEKEFRVTNGKINGAELRFTVIYEIKNQTKGYAMDYVVKNYGGDQPIITYNNFTTC